jgi:hypothetical protein
MNTTNSRISTGGLACCYGSWYKVREQRSKGARGPSMRCNACSAMTGVIPETGSRVSPQSTRWESQVNPA